MSRLTPSLIELNKGLDLQTPKITAEAGTVLDSLNYEQVDFQGQKRIDGFSRYDGSKLATFDDYYAIGLEEAFTGQIRDLLAVDGEVFAVVVSTNNNNRIAVAVINENLIPSTGDSLQLLSSADGSVVATFTVSGITVGVEWETSADTHYTNLLAYQSVLRQNVESLPGPIAGLHWFKDRLYAVADVVAVSLDGTIPQIFPNDELTLGSDTAKVLDSFVMQDTRLVFIDSFDTAGAWQVEGGNVTRNGDSVGTIAAGFNYFDSSVEIASFFESRSEQQVLEEDSGSLSFGWRFKDLGWKVNYADGISLYGSLPSVNQNIDGLGTQGPTSVTGNNGRPTSIRQNISITNNPVVQITGWKSSQTPTTYDLDIDNLTNVDDVFIYADAYITWNGETGAVSSPGLTTSSLEARDPAATVPVEITP